MRPTISKYYEELGSRIELARRGAHLTQAALAGRLGISRASIASIEGGRQQVHVHTAIALAEALNIPILALLAPSQNVATDEPSLNDLAPDEQEWVRMITKE